MRLRSSTKLLIAAAVLVVPSAAAQCPDSAARPSFVILRSPEDDRLRIDELRGCATPTLIRSPSVLSRPLASGEGFHAQVVRPRIESAWNSDLPLSVNDGARWAGRGASLTAAAGVRLRWGRISANVVPEVIVVENRPFPVLPTRVPDRDGYINVWHAAGRSIDAPLRFGYRSYTMILPGQSSATIDAGRVAAGVSTENLWWGPGVESAILMSNNAAGVPQIFLRTRRPVATPLGDLEARVLLGTLTESRFFDLDTRNDVRSLSGAVATLRMPFDTGFTIGAARVVFARMREWTRIGDHAADFALTLDPETRDELTSFFGAWRFPESNFEFHWEWARLRLPSARELLVAPQRTQGYTIGLQWMPLIRGDQTWLRTQLEATMLEQTLPPDLSTPPSFYTSQRVPQGYTQRGEVIGAPYGSGSSSQHAALDVVRPDWTAGLQVGRIRFENEAYYYQPTGLHRFAHDVAVVAAARASKDFSQARVRAEFCWTQRMNYLFQSAEFGIDWNRKFDIHNFTLRLAVSPAR